MNKIDIAMIQIGEEMMATVMIVIITEEGICREATRGQSGMIRKGIGGQEHQTLTLNVIEILVSITTTPAIMLKRKMNLLISYLSVDDMLILFQSEWNLLW